MEKVSRVIFRTLTDADFFNINKPIGTEERGGGQSYIDIPTTAVSERQWRNFLGQPTGTTSHGPKWEFEIHSLGVSGTQELTIGKRRDTTFSIRSQKLYSKASNRVHSWHPDHTNFPRPSDPSKRGNIYNLVIYLVTLENGEVWAGWFQESQPRSDWPINNALNDMFIVGQGGAGFIEDTQDVLFDSSDPEWPFRIAVKEKIRKKPTKVKKPSFREKNEEDILNELFDEDETIDSGKTPQEKEIIRKVKIRNRKAIRLLKELYHGRCQVTGEKFTFKKKDGQFYSEGHHLIPLGEGGADSPFNLVVVSPLIHRMLHYADVPPINLNAIKDNKLTIHINGAEYTITWQPKHANIIKRVLK